MHSNWNIEWTGRKLRSLLLRMILEEDVSLNHSSLTPHPTSVTKRVQIFFQKSTKRRLAIIDLKRHCIFLIRFDSTYSLLCYFILLYYLYSVIYCAFSTSFSQLSMLSLRHPITRVQWILLLSCSSRHSPWWWKPTVSRAKTFVIYNMSCNRGCGPERWVLLKKA